MRDSRKHQTIRETTFAMRGNTKPFGKRLSPCAEMPNHSGNDFRQARKCQTIRETTFAKRGNAKPFGKQLSPCAEITNLSGNDFRQARKCKTFRETTFATRGETRILYACSITKNGMHKKLHTTFYLNVMLFYLLTRSLTCSEGSYNPGRVQVCGLNLPHLISKQGG